MQQCVSKYSARLHGSAPGSIGQEGSVSERVLFKFLAAFSNGALDAENYRCGQSLAANMTSSADVDSWKALGGRIDQSSGTWYTATGELISLPQRSERKL